MKETDLGATVVAYLTREGFEVFQEVRTPDGAVCDIVAKRSGQLVTVECKTLLSWEVLAQAREWTDYANRSWIATPYFKRDWKQSRVIREVMEHFRLGYFVVMNGMVKPLVVAPINGVANTGYFTQILREEHKTFAPAGSNRGYFTDFKAVSAAVAAYVEKYPHGVPLKEICRIPEVKKHYKSEASARACIRSYCKDGVIKHVRAEQQNGITLIYPHRNPNVSEPAI